MGTVKFNTLNKETQATVVAFFGEGYIDDHDKDHRKPNWETLAIYRREGYDDKLVIIPRVGCGVKCVSLNEVYMEDDTVHLSRTSVGGVYHLAYDYQDNLGGQVLRLVK